jgi:hypothetical protein
MAEQTNPANQPGQPGRSNQPDQPDMSDMYDTPVLDGLDCFTTQQLLDWSNALKHTPKMRRSLADIKTDLAVACQLMLCYAGHGKYSKTTPHRQTGCVVGHLTVCHEVVSRLLSWIKGLFRRADTRQFMACSIEIDEALRLLGGMGGMGDIVLGKWPSDMVKQCSDCLACLRKQCGVQVLASNLPVMSATSILATLTGQAAGKANTKRKLEECSHGGGGSHDGGGGSHDVGGGGSHDGGGGGGGGGGASSSASASGGGGGGGGGGSDGDGSPANKRQAFEQSGQQGSQLGKSYFLVKLDAVQVAVKEVGKQGKTFTTCEVADWLASHRPDVMWKTRHGMVKYIGRMLKKSKTVAIKQDSGKQGADKQYTLIGVGSD